MEMRRKLTMLALGACLVVAAALPAVALAHHGHHKRDKTISGTVASFNNGMLAIKKSSGKIVTAQVVRRTEIECENENENENENEANDSRLAHASHDGGGDDGDRGDDNDNNENEVENEQNDQNDNEDQAENCDTTQLKPGTTVTRARLRDRGDNDFWKNLKLAS
jgi:hypothetical protein